MRGIDAEAVAGATDPGLARMIATSSPEAAHAAEAELYRRFAPRVRMYGLKHSRDEAAAQDLAQEVLLVTITRLRAREIRNPDQIASFILSTARMMTGALQRTARRRELLLEEYAHLARADGPPPAEALDLGRLERCLETLRERERSVLILTFYVECPAPEIAGTLGMSPGAVRVVRHRALSRMRECLEGRPAHDE